MNAASLTAALIALIGVWSAGAFVIFAAKPRALRLRGLYGRLCVQLSPDQRVDWPDRRFDEFKNLVREDTDLLTALEFIDDIDPRQSLLDRIGAISPSLFMFPIARLAIIGCFTALVFGPAFVAAYCLLFAESTRSLATTNLGLVLVIWLAAAGGVAFSLTMTMLVWRIFFERDVLSTMELVERHALWSAGVSRRPNNRRIISPKDDPGYSGLSK